MLKEKFLNEIKECKEKYLDIVKNDKWRNKYHIMAPIGWINDPNGLCEFNGEYHCFYQYSPLTPMGGQKFWGHYASKDLVNWEEKDVAIFPDIYEDKDGVYSGSAFVKDGTVYFFYTGNSKEAGDHDYIYTGRGHNVILVTSKDCVNFSEKTIVLRNEDYPSNMSCHVRDPKVWEEDGIYYMVLGARTRDDKGCILLYKSKDLYNWELHSIPAGEEEKMGYMWECPDIFKLNNKEVFMFSPQGVEAEGYKYNNVYQTGYTIGHFTDNKKVLEHGKFDEIDRGFDFYAPQSFEDSKGRRLFIGWMGVPDAVEHKNPTIDNFWQHQLSIPRELVLKDEKIYQIPVKELETLRKDKLEIKNVVLKDRIDKDIFESNTFELNIEFNDSNDFIVELREDCRLSFKDKVFKLELGKSGYGRDMRAVEIESVKSLRVFSDESSLEIFLNGGEEVFSTRIYNDGMDKTIKIEGNGTADIIRYNI